MCLIAVLGLIGRERVMPGGRGITLVAVTRGRGCNWRSLRPEQGPAFGLVAREAGPFCFTCIKEGPLARPSIVQSEVR